MPTKTVTKKDIAEATEQGQVRGEALGGRTWKTRKPMRLPDHRQGPGLQESPLLSAAAKADPSPQVGDSEPHAWSSSAWVRILALPFSICVTLGKVPCDLLSVR